MTKLKSYLLIAFISIIYLKTYSQEPNWMNQEFRDSKYSKEKYLSAFAHGEKLEGETVDEALERIKDIARSDIAKNLITKIESVSDYYVENETINDNESFYELFKSSIKTESKAEINGITIDSYYNEEKSYVFAFGYANIYKIIGYYDASINMNIAQVEGFISAAKQFIDSDEKSKARKQLLKSVPLFAKIEYSQGLLLAVDEEADMESVQTSKSIKLRNIVNQLLAELEQSTFVFINCSTDIFEKKSELLNNKLKSILSKEGCSFTENKTEANWVINIDSKAREYSNPSGGIFFSYVDAVIDLTKVRDNKTVYTDELKKKGGGRDYTDAAKKAVADIAKLIAEKIIPWINK